MKLAIYGAGGMGAEFLHLVRAINEKENCWDECFFVDDGLEENKYCDLDVYKYEEVISKYRPNEVEFTISVGEPIVRELLAKKIESAGFELATLIHPGFEKPYGVKIGKGTVIMNSLVRLGSFALIGENVLIQALSGIGHNSKIGDNCNISCNVQISGGCSVDRNVFFGIRSTIKEGIKIGRNAIIGMSASVFRDVPENHTVFQPASKMVEHSEGTMALGGKYE